MKKLLFFILFLMLPIFVMADSGVDYEEAVHYTNNYIYSFDKYNSYLFFKDKLEYVYEDGVFSYNPDFKSGGMLSKTEYEISNREGNTFLSNGLEYWTLSKSSGGRHYVINYRLQEKLDTLNSGVRVTEYVKQNSIVSGKGSYADPWQFSEVLNLHLNSTNIIRGKVSTVTCGDTSMQKETVTLSFTSGSRVDAYICPASGYTVFTNSCSGYMTKDLNNKYVVSGVSKDNLICNIIFTYSTNAVTLGCDNCNTAPSPSTIYSNKVHDLWFNNKNGLDENKITKITTVPFKTGYTFKGFYKDGMLVIDTSGNLMDDSTSVITSNVSIDALFDANKYEVDFDVEDPTDDDHTKNEEVIYDSMPERIMIPKRAYTVTYNANGGTVSRTKDIVTYNFVGYYSNGVQYFNSDGTSSRKWDIAEDITLTGKWSGGTVSFPTATRPGYKLVGWYDSNENKVENGSQVTKNLSLTAKWEAIDVNYKVKHYKENIDGSYASPAIETFTAKTATTVTPGVKTYTGFTSPAVQSAVVDGSGTTVIEYRYLRNKYTVTMAINNTSYGSLNKSSLTIKHGTTYSVNSSVLTFSDGQKVTATATAKTGYTTTFSSWSPSSGTITAATTITANFSRSPIKYTYTFTSTNSSYGSVSPTSLSVPYDSTYSVSGNVLTFSDGQKVTATATAKTGYTTTFSSWSSTSGTVKGAASISASFSRTANQYSIIYNCNGGTPTTAYSSVHTYDLSANLKANQCSRSGFSYQGWNTAANGSGTSYTDQQVVSNLKSANNDSINLYAKWKDVSNPSCKLKATASGVTFESKTDNVGVTSFGLIKSTTATYNGTSTLALSNGTFYGYVMDAAGNTGKCQITIGGTYVSSYTKTTKTCNRSVASYDKTVQTCNRSVASYTKTTKKCKSTIANYTREFKTCNRSIASYKKIQKYCTRSIQGYIRSYQLCNQSLKNYTKTTAKCNASYSGTCKCKQTMFGKAYSFSCGSYSSCSSLCNAKGYPNSSGSCSLSTSWSTSTSTVSSCSTSSYFTCNIKANGSTYVQSCTPNYSYSFVSRTSSGDVACNTNSAFTCNSTRYGDAYTTKCTPVYSYYFQSATTSYPSSCSANSINCNASTYGSYDVSCSVYTYNYNFGSTSTQVTPSCGNNVIECNSGTYGDTYSKCTPNYSYSWDSSSSSTVSSCSANSISCTSSTVGQSHVACSTNYNYAFTSSTLSAQSSCSTSGSFTCGSSTFGQTYVSNCKTNYNYAFGSSTSTTSSCSVGSSFTCNSSNYGNSYVSGCSAAAYACNDSGYTKINNSYCYKY